MRNSAQELRVQKVSHILTNETWKAETLVNANLLLLKLLIFKFDFHMSVHRKYISKVYFYKLLYMFQAVHPLIIRSIKLLLSWMR